MRRVMRQDGFSLTELLIAMALAALLLGGLQQWLASALAAAEQAEARDRLARDARFAMNRMVMALRRTDSLLLPLVDNPLTDYRENVRVQTVPASPPEGSSTFATAVLAVTLDRAQDLDGDGVFDADNDGDGRFDEDPPADAGFDGADGLPGIDDNGDGAVDATGDGEDDDEDRSADPAEDPVNGVDDDGDGSIDEDTGGDRNNDGAAGVAGVDDDGDGDVDEGNKDDDDEDGFVDEDWIDAVAFFLSDGALIERRAVPWDTDGDKAVTGADVVETVIAENVVLLSVERLARTSGQAPLVALTLGLAGDPIEGVEVSTSVRVGGAL